MSLYLEVLRRFESMKASDMPSAHRFVWAMYAQHANEDNKAWPSLATLYDETAYGKTKLAEVIADLVDHGFLRPDGWVGQGLRRSARYEVRLDGRLWPEDSRAHRARSAERARAARHARTLSLATREPHLSHGESLDARTANGLCLATREGQSRTASTNPPGTDQKNRPEEPTTCAHARAEDDNEELGGKCPDGSDASCAEGMASFRPQSPAPIELAVIGAPQADGSSSSAKPAEEAASNPKPTGEQPSLFDLPPTPKAVKRDIPAEVFAAYLEARTRFGRKGITPKLTPKRRLLVHDRLKDGYSAEELCLAARGLWLSDHHTQDGYDGFEYAMRATNVEPFAARETKRLEEGEQKKKHEQEQLTRPLRSPPPMPERSPEQEARADAWMREEYPELFGGA